MPVYVNTQKKAWQCSYKHELLNRDLFDCYNRILKKEPISTLIRSHSNFINKLQLSGHNKNHKTLAILIHYKNTKNKAIALSTLTNSLNNRNIFSLVLSEEEGKEKYWKNKGAGKVC